MVNSNYGRIYDTKRSEFTSQRADKDGYMTCSLICNNGYTKRKVTVKLLGGDLKIEWNEKDNHVYMEGTATEVFEGKINW